MQSGWANPVASGDLLQGGINALFGDSGLGGGHGATGLQGRAVTHQLLRDGW